MSAAPILMILKDGETVKSVVIESEAMLGRGDDCVIRLEDRAISHRRVRGKVCSASAGRPGNMQPPRSRPRTKAAPRS